METKEQLQAKVETLQSQISNLTSELQREQKVLENVNKPVMSEDMYSLLDDVLRDFTDNLTFSEDDFDWEPEFYGKEIQLGCIQFLNQCSMHDDIMRYIDGEFRVIENEELPLNSGDIAVEQTATHA
tara:strand:+ start:1120 stop:1500 length:381 start_codon:yes stop_codon:yes gene_type:complete